MVRVKMVFLEFIITAFITDLNIVNIFDIEKIIP